MSYILVQGGTSLYAVDTTTGAATALTLPTGVRLDSGKRARFAMLGRQVVLVNSPSESLWIDPHLTVRRMGLKPPASPCILSAGAAGALTGKYRVCSTFVVRDPDTDELIAESAAGPVSAESGTLASQNLAVAGVPISEDSGIFARRNYRTNSGPGDVYYPWFDLDGNVASTFEDGTADAGTGFLPISTDLGTPPAQIELITEWKGRLWAKSLDAIDNAYYSADGKHYGWPSSNYLVVKPIGKDDIGVTGFLPRRDELGIGKRRIFWKVTGSSSANFSLIRVKEGIGIEAPDSVVVVNDRGFFLGGEPFGVYRWDNDGLVCVSRAKVDPWFTTGTYFNQARFRHAFGHYNPRYDLYELFLAAAGSSVENRYIAYEIGKDRWWGPHVVADKTFTCAGAYEDADGLTVPVFGALTGYLLKQNQATYADDGSITSMKVVTGGHHQGNPKAMHYFGELTVLNKTQVAGTLNVVPTVGKFGASPQAAVPVDLTQERTRGRRLGDGEVCQLSIEHAVLNEGAAIYGYEIEPAFEVGVR